MNQSDETDLERFNSLLPFYLNGTAGGEDCLFVEKILQQSEAARAQLATEHALVEHLDSAINRLPDDIGKSAVDKIRREIAGKKAATDASRQLWWKNMLVAILGQRQALQAAFAVLIVIQTGMVATLLLREHDGTTKLLVASDSSAPQYRGGETAHQLIVKFKPSATESQIFDVLTGINGRITDGPRQLGDYVVTVDVSDSQIDNLVQTLRKSAYVERVKE